MIEASEGFYFYVYKSPDGDCWFEYTPMKGGEANKKLSYLGNSVLVNSNNEDEVCKMVLILDEE